MGRAVRLTDEQRRELWSRWKRGETLVEIGRVLGRSTPNVFHLVRAGGGIGPRERQERSSALTVAEREEISRGLVAGFSLRAIARRLKRHASTVSREVAHNGGRQDYRAMAAQERAIRFASRPKACLLAQRPELQALVAAKLEQKWSPQQISGWLRHSHGQQKAMQVSHETIYKSLFIQARGVLRRELLGALRSRKLMRRAHGARSQAMKRSLIPDAVSIRERPAEAEDRALPGHWEGDLLMGGVSSRIATLVERRSRFVQLVRIGAKTSEDVVDALARQVQALAGLIGHNDKQGDPTLIWTVDDNGWVYEGRITTPTQALYHAYPLLPSDAFAKIVIARYAEWAYDEADARTLSALQNALDRYS